MLTAALTLAAMLTNPARSQERSVTPAGYGMRLITGGTFTMGCTPEQEPECWADEKPAHFVNLNYPFLMGEVEVTRGLYRKVAGGAPKAYFCTSDDCPAVMVSWYDAVSFANAMSTKEGLKPCYDIQGEAVTWPEGLLCEGYRLPTEAEWEYAARAGTNFKYAGSDDISQVAWYDRNSGWDVHRVGGKAPNSWGIYDMSGNTWEWVWGGRWTYPERANDPVGSLNERRVLRGGSYSHIAAYARVAFRGYDSPGVRYSDVGIRLARTDPAHIAYIKAAESALVAELGRRKEARRLEEELARQVILSEDSLALEEDGPSFWFLWFLWLLGLPPSFSVSREILKGEPQIWVYPFVMGILLILSPVWILFWILSKSTEPSTT
jgi:sulfatase modifying factor 1